MNECLGLKKPSARELLEERERRMRNLYVDPVEHFPEQIDRLMTALNKVSVFCLQ